MPFCTDFCCLHAEPAASREKKIRPEQKILQRTGSTFNSTTVSKEVFGERGSLTEEKINVIKEVSFKTSYKYYGKLFWKVDELELGGFQATPPGIIHPQSHFMAVSLLFVVWPNAVLA
jgi:hypothetical protein